MIKATKKTHTRVMGMRVRFLFYSEFLRVSGKMRPESP